MSEAPLVLVSEVHFERERVIDGLTAAGCRTAALPRQTADAASVTLLAEAAAIIAAPQASVTESHVGAASGLRIVTSPVIGTDHIDVEGLTRRGVPVAHGADPVNFAGMAEAVVGLFVALSHRFRAKEEALRRGRGRLPDPGSLLAGKTVGLIGLGRIGRSVAVRLRGWDCRVLVVDPALRAETAQELGVEPAPLATVLTEADLVSVHVPLAAGTRGLIGGPELARMKPTAHLVNVSRGGVVDEHALYVALTTERLAGAANDVWHVVPPAADHPLLSLGDKVIATGHNVGHTSDAYRRLADLAVEQTILGLTGRSPKRQVNVPAVDDQQ